MKRLQSSGLFAPTRGGVGWWLAVLIAVSTGSFARGAVVTLDFTDAINTSSLNSAGNWSNEEAPSPDNDYFVNRTLRTPPSGAHTFAGNSLTIGSSGLLAFKTHGVITVDDLRMAGGQIAHWGVTGDGVARLAGTMTLTAGTTSRLSPNGPERPILVQSTITGPGNLNKISDGAVTLTAENDYTGTTTVSAGSLLVNGSTAAASAFTVNSGATLGGTGTIGGPTNIRSGGTLSPGVTVGTLTFGNDLTLEAGAVWDWEYLNNLDPANYDRVVLNDPFHLLLPESGTITLNIRALAESSINWYDAFTIFEGDVLHFDPERIILVDEHSGWTRGWRISAGDSLVLMAVPEPGAWILLLGALGCGLLVRRR